MKAPSPVLLKQNEGTVRVLEQSSRTDETKPVSIKEECVGKNKGTTHDPKPPPCLSNMAVVLLQLRCVWLPMELAHWYLLEDFFFACRSNRMNAGSFWIISVFIKCSKTASSLTYCNRFLDRLSWFLCLHLVFRLSIHMYICMVLMDTTS